MFNQTFLDGRQKTRKPYTVVLSLLLQASAICILILLPLVYTEALPGAQLKSMLATPAPPPAPSPIPAAKSQPKPVFRRLDARQLIAPRIVPPQVNMIREAPAPELGVLGSIPGPATGGNGVIDSILTAVPNSAPPLPSTAVKPKRSSGPIRVASVLSQANLIRQVQPIYPSLAKSARVQGTVEFTAVIGKEGNIENLQLIRGHPLLVNAAREAILQWKYRPTLLNGSPVEVVTEIIVNFTLSP